MLCACCIFSSTKSKCRVKSVCLWFSLVVFWLWTTTHTDFHSYSAPCNWVLVRARLPDSELKCTSLSWWCWYPGSLWPQWLPVLVRTPLSPGCPCLRASARQWRRAERQRWHPCWKQICCMEDSERISLSLVVTVGARGPQGWRCSWLQWPQDPPGPRPDSARRPDGTDCQPVSFRGRGG